MSFATSALNKSSYPQDETMKMTNRDRLIAMSVCTVLSAMLSLMAGCALDSKLVAPTPVQETRIAAPKPSSADLLVEQLQSLQLLSNADLVAAREKNRETFEREQTAQNRMNYALAWFLSATPNTIAATDDDKLSVFVEPLATATNADTATRTIAGLIQQATQMRKKIRDDAKAAVQRASPKRDDPARDAEVKLLRAKIDDLEKQLAALKLIERSVNRR